MQLKARAQWRVSVYSVNSKLKKENIPQTPKIERQVEWKQIPVHVGRQHADNQQEPQSLTLQTGRKQRRAMLYVQVRRSLVPTDFKGTLIQRLSDFADIVVGRGA